MWRPSSTLLSISQLHPSAVKRRKSKTSLHPLTQSRRVARNLTTRSVSKIPEVLDRGVPRRRDFRFTRRTNSGSRTKEEIPRCARSIASVVFDRYACLSCNGTNEDILLFRMHTLWARVTTNISALSKPPLPFPMVSGGQCVANSNHPPDQNPLMAFTHQSRIVIIIIHREDIHSHIHHPVELVCGIQ